MERKYSGPVCPPPKKLLLYTVLRGACYTKLPRARAGCQHSVADHGLFARACRICRSVLGERSVARCDSESYVSSVYHAKGNTQGRTTTNKTALIYCEVMSRNTCASGIWNLYWCGDSTAWRLKNVAHLIGRERELQRLLWTEMLGHPTRRC
jgi:hypothetical protein